MLVYPLAELERNFSVSADPVGFLDPATCSVLYGNRAFEQAWQNFYLATGKNPLHDLADVVTAMKQCHSNAKPSMVELPAWHTRIELLPVYIKNADDQLQPAVHYKLLSLAPSEQFTLGTEALESLPISTWAISVNGEIFWTNRASKCYAHGDLEAAQLGHQQHMGKIHPEDVEASSLTFSSGMADGMIPSYRNRLRHHDGHYEWFSVEASPVRATDGSIRYWIGHSVNIDKHVREQERLQTEVRHLQQQLQEAQALASSAQKIELISHLAGGVAHDLNNLLFVMRMHIDSMGNKHNTTAQQTNLLAVQDCIRKAARLSTQLSGFSGRLPQNAIPLNPTKFVEDMHNMFQQAVGAEVNFRTEVAPGIATMLADRSYLENALINLLINARDAVDGRGTVSLTVDMVEQNGDTLEPQTFVAFHVTDDGIGMSPELQAKVFEPFFTTKAPDRGTGLGLAMVKNFAENSGGHITVQSTLGIGSTLSLLLPLAASGQEEQENLIPHEAPLPPGSGSVLLLEDDESVRQVVSLVLREQGYRILAAPNPEQAIGLLELGIAPDLILSDIRMPGKKTVQDLIKYVESNRPTPMIFMTGYSADLVIKEGLMGERYPVLFKPVSSQELLHKVAEVMLAASQQR